MYEVFKANQIKPKLVIASFLPLLQSTATQAFNGALTYSVPIPQPLKSRTFKSSNVRPKDKTWLLDLVLAVNKCLKKLQHVLS